MNVISKPARDLVAGDRIVGGLLVHEVWVGKVVDTWSENFAQRDAVFFTLGESNPPRQLWRFPDNEVEVLAE